MKQQIKITSKKQVFDILDYNASLNILKTTVQFILSVLFTIILGLLTYSVWHDGNLKGITSYLLPGVLIASFISMIASFIKIYRLYKTMNVQNNA